MRMLMKSIAFHKDSTVSTQQYPLPFYTLTHFNTICVIECPLFLHLPTSCMLCVG